MEDPHESYVVLTEDIKRHIRTLLLTESLPNDTREELIKYTKSRRSVEDKKPRTIPFRLVQIVHKHLECEQGGIHLHEMLEGSDLHLPNIELPPRSPELEARLERLRAEQANREYDQMTRNVHTQQLNQRDQMTVGQEIQSLNRHIINIFNFVLTVGGSFAFAFKAVEYSMHDPSFELQLGAGIIVGTIVFIADLYFLIRSDAVN